MIYGKGACLDDLDEIVNRVTTDLRKYKTKFDFIAVRGCSGMVVGAPVSIALKKPLVIVRKDDERSHDWGVGRKFVNHKHARGRYVFLDDFISSGHTLSVVRDELAKLNTEEPHRGIEYVASYEYQHEDVPFTWEPAETAVAA